MTQHLALMFCDLDSVKLINDRYSHAIGDLLLKEAASRMQDCVRETDTVARIGGDEFVVLLPSIKAERHATLVVEKIRAALNGPVAVAGHSLPMSASIGVTVYPQHGEDDVALSRHADEAMYRAKQGGRNGMQMYQVAGESVAEDGV